MILLKNCNYIITQNANREIIRNKDILIENNKIKEIGSFDTADEIIDCSDKIVMPGLINCHTHAAMTLFRGYGDDMPLMEWLEKKIWPAESKLNKELIHWGTKLAIVEMIKTGTTCFNDMYCFMEDVSDTVKEVGMRAVLSYGFIDMFNEEKRIKEINATKKFVEYVKNMNCDLIKSALGPHSIYTVSNEGLKWCKKYSDENDLLIHIHLSETSKEVKDCIEKHNKTPVEYLNSLNFFSNKVIVAHGIWIDEKELSMLKDVSIVHNPVSNMKLGSGRMQYEKIKSLNICLGTDGTASNNNLNMFEEMKIAVILQKLEGDPTNLNAQEVLDMVTINGAKALKLNTGSIEAGKLADIIIIDCNRSDMVPLHNVISNIVYSFDGNVNTSIVNGKILMKNYKLINIDEQEIYNKVNLFKF